MQRSLADLNRQWRRWIVLILIGVLTFACCAWTGLLGWFFTPFTPYFANHLDRVQGKLELLVPAQWEPGWSEVSPDGHWMVTSWAKTGHEELFVWDLITNQQMPLNAEFSTMRWLNKNQFVAISSSQYYIVSATNQVIQPIERMSEAIYLQPGGFERIVPWLKQAQQVYIIPRQSGANYQLIILSQQHWYVLALNSYELKLTNSQLDALVASIPHIELMNSSSNQFTPDGRLYSGDGQLYAKHELVQNNTRVLIYTRSGELVADAGKDGWTATILGWAHDSSGVYIRTSIYGQAAGMMVPYRPLFKLSPLTPEEERAQWWWSVGEWTAGSLAAVGVVGWVVWRRRRK